MTEPAQAPAEDDLDLEPNEKETPDIPPADLVPGEDPGEDPNAQREDPGDSPGDSQEIAGDEDDQAEDAEDLDEETESPADTPPAAGNGKISKARKKALAKLEGLIDPETGLILAELAAAVPADQVIVEIGAYKGKSAAYLAEGAKAGRGAMVYSVDPWDTRGNITGRFGFADPATFEAYQAQIEKMKLTDRVTPIKAFSIRAAKTWPKDRPIGLLYIDGSHRYYDVRADFQAWARFVALGGVVVFDDYTGPNHGVARAANWAKQNFRTFRDWDYSQIPLAICRRVR